MHPGLKPDTYSEFNNHGIKPVVIENCTPESEKKTNLFNHHFHRVYY